MPAILLVKTFSTLNPIKFDITFKFPFNFSIMYFILSQTWSLKKQTSSTSVRYYVAQYLYLNNTVVAILPLFIRENYNNRSNKQYHNKDERKKKVWTRSHKHTLRTQRKRNNSNVRIALTNKKKRKKNIFWLKRIPALCSSISLSDWIHFNSHSYSATIHQLGPAAYSTPNVHCFRERYAIHYMELL